MDFGLWFSGSVLGLEFVPGLIKSRPELSEKKDESKERQQERQETRDRDKKQTVNSK